MGAAPKNLSKGDILFREGDASDSAYVVKSGRIVITKAKGNSEIELASLGPGEMFGEMAFFDNKPRSASAKAAAETTLVALPFAALNAQFQTFPQWLKAMVRTVNENLREANKRIKNLEQAQKGDDKVFTPYTITKLCAILSLVANKYGDKQPEGVVVPTGVLRNFTIQVFQEPTNKMTKLMEVLQALEMLKVEDLGEGRQKLTIFKLDMLSQFVEFYNKWLFTEQSKRVLVEQNELKILRAAVFYKKNSTPDAKGFSKISLTKIQNESMKDLGYLVGVNNWSSIIEKKIVSEKISDPDGVSVMADISEIEKILPFWEIIYALESVQK